MVTILCTVGTSLLGNIKNSKTEAFTQLTLTIEKASHIASILSSYDPSDRNCGAEVNSLNSLVKLHPDTDLEKLVLFTSDTDDGRLVGAILKSFFSNQRTKLNFKTFEVIPVKDLNDNDRQRFKSSGLRTLVRVMTDSLKQARSFGHEVLINATGGYKAQIAYATLISQLLKAPVYYQFERFPEIIEMPVMPVGFDLSLYLLHAELLNEMEDNLIPETDSRLCAAPAALEPMFYREDGKVILTALGSLYTESMRDQFRAMPPLPPASNKSPADKKIISSHGHHRPRAVEPLIEQLIQLDQIVAVHHEPGQPTHRFLEFKTDPDVSVVKAHVRDTAGMNPPCTLVLHTTSRTIIEQAALRLWLEEKFCNGTP